MLQLSGIQPGQVLQRQRGGAMVSVSGISAQAGALTVSLLKNNTTVSGWRARTINLKRPSKFTLTLSGLPVGGPFRLKFSLGGSVEKLGPFYVGDVWILAGQSNMQGRARRPPQGEGRPPVRALRMNRRWERAADPLHLLEESPDPAHYSGPSLSAAQIEKLLATEPRGGGPGVWFGNEMLTVSGVPQGLICAAHGGTSMEQWSPKLKHLGGGSLYGSLMKTVSATGQPVAGVLWYQGENDANPTDAPHYTLRMKQLVAALRRDLRLPALPWVIVQLARTTSPADERSWFSIREQQRALPLTVKNLAVVAALDLPMDDWIHIGGEGMSVLGKRLALAMRSLRGDGQRPPDVAAARWLPARADLPERIEVTLKNIAGGLRLPRAAGGFFTVSADGKIKRNIFSQVTAADSHRLLLDLAGSFDNDGDRLMYGQDLNTDARITDARDLALPAFGPLTVSQPRGLTPFLRRWRVSELSAGGESLFERACPADSEFPAAPKIYPDAFVNEHAAWQGRAGRQFFRATVSVPRATNAKFHLGYDGPFRLWVDGREVFADPRGINPAFKDERIISVPLAGGERALTVGMDTNNGQAWGFFLRLRAYGVAVV